MSTKRGKTQFSLPERLRKARLDRDLSQQELAGYAGVQANQISRYEKGLSQPTAEKLHRMAEALEVSADFLMNGETTNAARANLEDQELLKLFQKAGELTPENKTMLKRFVNMLLNQQKIDEMATSRTG